MPRLALLSGLAAGLFLMAGCTAQDGTPVGENLCGLYDEVSPDAFGPDLPVADATAFVGKSEDEAKALAQGQGIILRVVGRDGGCVGALSDDLRSNRVNIYLDDGEVKEARTF